jgi:Ca-activated chloride channel family protein
MISFADPGFLLLLLAVPLWLWARRTWLRPPTLAFSSLASLESHSRKGRARWAGLPEALQVLGLVGLVIALARPVQEERHVSMSAEGTDILLLIDVSSSMSGRGLAEDRSNLEVAREIVKGFVDARLDDRLGVIAFARFPKRICPLTADRDAIKALIDRLQAVPRGTDLDGTGIGAALAEAARLVSDMEDAQPPDTESCDRVVVLLTDGEENQHRIEPLDAARLLADAGIRVYTVSAAGPEGAEAGGALSRPDEDLLEAVANITGGRHSSARSAEDIEAVYDEIDRLEKKPVMQESWSEQHDLYRAFLGPAAILIAFAVFLRKTLLARMP